MIACLCDTRPGPTCNNAYTFLHPSVSRVERHRLMYLTPIRYTSAIDYRTLYHMTVFKPFSAGALTLTLCLLCGSSAAAGWTGGLEGGTVMRDGESFTRVRAHASLNERPLNHHVYAEWYRGDASNIELGYKPRYWLNDRVYAFGEGKMRFAEDIGIDRETQLFAGPGLQLRATAQQQLYVEAGVGYRHTAYSDELRLDDSSEQLGVVRAGGSQILSDLFKLDFFTDVFASPSYVQTQFEVGASVRVPQGAIRVSYRVRRVDIDELSTVDESDTALEFTIGF